MRVFLYDEQTCPALRVEALAEEVARLTGAVAEVRDEFVRDGLGRTHGSAPTHDRGSCRGGPMGPPPTTTTDGLARALAKARVVDPMHRLQPAREPMPAEIAAEQRVLETPGKASLGILYDGAVVQWLMAELLDAGSAGTFAGSGGIPDLHLILTARLLGTFVPDDRRWHAHTVLLGNPALVSTTGLVQAPARPKEYYQGQGLATSRLAPMEVVQAELQQRLADRMLLPDDPRIISAAVGCALQAVAFHLTGEAFCLEPTCRLFNARRQEELVRSQCSPEAGLCARHQALFAGMQRAADE